MAGEVVAVGDGVEHWAPGQPVVAGGPGGAFAQYAVYPAAALRRKPDALSFAQAAAFGSAYLTAWVALVRRARLEPGEWVLVLQGAASLRLETVPEARHLRPGDHVHIPAGLRHRVEATQAEPPTIWLAVHYG